MQNEKLKILKMLENGQISATDAAQLLQAVSSGPSPALEQPGSDYAVPAPPMPTSPPPQHFPQPPTAPAPMPTSASTDSYARSNRPSGSSPDRAEDLSRKFESFAKEMAPKVHRFTETVAGKIVSAADRVSEAFAYEPPPASAAGQPHRVGSVKPSPIPSGGLVEKNVELAVEVGGYNELSLSSLNAEVRIKGFNSDKITASLRYKAKKHGASIELMKLGGKYFLKYEPDEFHSVGIDAFVPERAFSVIKVDGVNGPVDCSSLAANEMRISNANSTTRIEGIAADTLEAESSGGEFRVSNIAAKTARIENLNGHMEAIDLDIANLKLTNYNSPLSIIMSKYDRHVEYTWAVETGNAKLTMNLPTMPNLGYHIKAHAAMSEIRLGLTGLQFFINEPSLVEARSISFDTASKKVKMSVETSNAPLLIN